MIQKKSNKYKFSQICQNQNYILSIHKPENQKNTNNQKLSQKTFIKKQKRTQKQKYIEYNKNSKQIQVKGSQSHNNYINISLFIKVNQIKDLSLLPRMRNIYNSTITTTIMEKSWKNVLSSIFSVFILVLIVSLGPANAISISVTPSTSTVQYGEYVTFTASVDIENLDRVPITNLSAIILDSAGSEVARCYFNIAGNKINPCASSFGTITRIKSDATYDYGNLVGIDYNNTQTNFGYGYGYGYNGILGDTELEYNIQWQTPAITNVTSTYSIKIEINAQNSNIQKTYETQNNPSITVEMNRPIARMSRTNYTIMDSQKVIVDARASSDPNNFNITSYKVYNGNTLIYSSTNPQFSFSLFERDYNLRLIVTNQYGITSLPRDFTVKVLTEFDEDNFVFDVDNYVENGKIKFKLTTLQNFNKKSVKLTPQIECMGINFDYKQKIMDSEIILDEKNKTYSLFVMRDDFDIKVPLNNDCEFRLTLYDEKSGQKVTLKDKARFSSEITFDEEREFDINNGNDLLGYILHAFSKDYQKGYQPIKFRAKNTGPIDIKGEFKIIIQDFNYEYYEEIKLPSNAETMVSIPLYIDKNTPEGRYPVRISYRLNEGDLKVVYGYLIIK